MTINASTLPATQVAIVGTEVIVHMHDDDNRCLQFSADSFDAIYEWAAAIAEQARELDQRRIDAGPDDIEF